MRAILKAEVETRVQFHHLDPMNIVWHGNHADFFELARVELMEMMDYSYPQMNASGYAWPVIELKIRYAKPILFRMRILVRGELVEWENRLKILFSIYNAEAKERLCSGHTIQVAVNAESGEMLWETPDVFRKKLEPFLK